MLVMIKYTDLFIQKEKHNIVQLFQKMFGVQQLRQLRTAYLERVLVRLERISAGPHVVLVSPGLWVVDLDVALVHGPRGLHTVDERAGGRGRGRRHRCGVGTGACWVVYLLYYY